MKNNHLTLFRLATIFFVLTIFISSCSTVSISQRRYNKGFHVEFGRNSNQNNIAKSKSRQNDDIAVVESKTEIPNEILNKTETTQSQFASVKNAEISNSSSINSELITIHKKEEVLETNTITVKTIQKKEVKKVFKAYKSKNKSSKEILVSDRMLLLTIIAFLLPPLAVYLYEGSWTRNCTINVLFTLLFWVPGIIHALLLIYGYI